MKLVIAEKPSVAQAIAKVIGANKRQIAYLEGNGYQVSWCIGHLVALCEADVYDGKYKKWRYKDLPIIPTEWKYQVLEKTKKQFQVLKKLMNAKEISEVICATDAGREGELIFRLVYQQAGCKKAVKRLWISSMEEKAIEQGFKELKDGSVYDSLYESALCRAKADWLVGINASRLFSVLTDKSMKVGRVQTPTLSMIVDRDKKITNFQSEKYYQVYLTIGERELISNKTTDEALARRIALTCQGKQAIVKEIKIEPKQVKAPKLYDLTTLQREANRIYGYSAKETLQLVQNLYEKKLVTYPRTDSQYLTDEMEESVDELLKEIPKLLPFTVTSMKNMEVSRVINSQKVSDHHAIILTKKGVKQQEIHLFEEEKMILLLIASKMLMAVLPDYSYESIKIEVNCEGYSFYTTLTRSKFMGFRELELALKKFLKNQEQKTEEEWQVKEGEELGLVESKMITGQTKPPNPFTEDTLLAMMERAGNEELGKGKDEIEKNGIGTPVTRAGIIEKLINSGFVKRVKKTLISTDEGKALIAVLPESIQSPKMTAYWEKELNRIANQEEESAIFMEDITQMIKDLVKEYPQNNKKR